MASSTIQLQIDSKPVGSRIALVKTYEIGAFAQRQGFSGRCYDVLCAPYSSDEEPESGYLRFCLIDSVGDMCRGMVTSVLFVTSRKLTVATAQSRRKRFQVHWLMH